MTIVGKPEVLTTCMARQVIYHNILIGSGKWTGDIPKEPPGCSFYCDFVYKNKKGKFLIRAYYIVCSNGTISGECFERYRCKDD